MKMGKLGEIGIATELLHTYILLDQNSNIQLSEMVVRERLAHPRLTILIKELPTMKFWYPKPLAN